MLNKVWNQKPQGLLGALWLTTQIVIKRIHIKAHSWIVRHNLSSTCNATIYPGTWFRFPSKVEIGRDVYVGYRCRMDAGDIGEGSLVLKDGVSIDMDCIIDYSGGLIVGKNSHIAFGSYIITHSHGYNYKNRPTPMPLSIGENVFVGAQSTILPSVSSIGNNAVIGTGSVVTKDVPENAIVAGNPARIIKYRDDL